MPTFTGAFVTIRQHDNIMRVRYAQIRTQKSDNPKDKDRDQQFHVSLRHFALPCSLSTAPIKNNDPARFRNLYNS